MLLNLCVNAKDAMPQGGTITISTENLDIDEQYCDLHQVESGPGKYLVLSVQDTGTGIAEEHRSQIFEPFFTTKEIGKGTGLGLAMVYGIVKHHGGFIKLDSTSGQGTCFKIFLPAIIEKSESHQTEHASVLESTVHTDEMNEKKEKHILVVDDEDVVRFLAMDLLENMGYQAIPAEDGEQAVEIFESRKDDIDLVLLDMIMPKLGGVETFRELRKIDPEVPVVLLSGYTKDVAAQELLSEGARGFLQKPYKIQELAQVVETI